MLEQRDPSEWFQDQCLTVRLQKLEQLKTFSYK
jgi:hypothetical protein